MPDALMSGADGSDGAVCVDAERDAGGGGTVAGCAAANEVLGAGDVADVVVNHVVGGADVGMAVCASEDGAVRPVQLNYCLWY